MRTLFVSVKGGDYRWLSRSPERPPAVTTQARQAVTQTAL
jgi:hypothetical protein